MTMLDQLAWARAPDHEKMPMLRRVALIGSTWKLSVITRARFVLNEHTLDLWARESREIDNRSKIMTVCTILLPIEGDCVLILITSKLFEHFIICIVLFSFFYVLFQIKLLYYQSFCINYQIFLYGLWYVIIKFKKFSKLEKFRTPFSLPTFWITGSTTSPTLLCIILYFSIQVTFAYFVVFLRYQLYPINQPFQFTYSRFLVSAKSMLSND